MRRWLVAGAVIEGPEGVLLVQNRRRDGRVDWSPPGGVVDPGEPGIEGNCCNSSAHEPGTDDTDPRERPRSRSTVYGDAGFLLEGGRRKEEASKRL